MKGRIDIVSASAGSGKTTRLARELETAVMERGISPDRIIAMTFTRKAAAELVRRGRQSLLRNGRSDEVELFAAARIGTVNAVSGMLVSEFAFEAGVSPELIVLDEARAAEAFRRSLGDVVSRDDVDELTRLSGRFDDFPWPTIVSDIADAARTNHISADVLGGARERSVQSFLELLDAPADDAETLDAGLERALEKAINALREVNDLGRDKTKKSAETLGAYEHAWASLHARRSLPWSTWTELAQREAAVKSDAACADVRKAAQVLLRHPGFRTDNELAIRLCFDLACRALVAYQRFKAQRRAIDFIDQETIALALLARPDVQEVLADEIALVLVDEFQDSSPLELALFLALSRIAPQSVWVGDQKQAIYGFRGADPALMEDVIAELLQGREPETLRIGRRSRAPLVHLTNALFVPPFRDAGLSSHRVTLEPAIQDDSPLLGPCVERWRLEAQSQAHAATELATLVRQLLDDPDVFVRGEGGNARRVRPGDIAILCRRRETCLKVAEELSHVEVHAEIALGGLLTTPEGRVVNAGLRLWTNANDLLARAEIVRLVQPEATPIDVLVDGSNADRWREIDSMARLLAAREASPHAGALEAFDAVLLAICLDDLVVSWDRGLRGIANLDALRAHAVNFVRLARHRGGTASPAGLVAYLDRLAEGTDDAQAAFGGTDAASVTTWHAAKGLEWPIVVLYEIDGSFSRTVLGVHVDDQPTQVRRLDDPLAGRTIRYWPQALRSDRSALRQRLAEHRFAVESTQRVAHEELRLLYVGFSRARDRLVLAGCRDLAKGALALFARGGGIVPDEPITPSASNRTQTTVNWGGCSTTVIVRSAPSALSSHAPHDEAATHAWVLKRPELRTHEPAIIAAAMCEGQGTIASVERLGPPLSIRTVVNPRALGNAVHAFFAADRARFDDDDRAELAGRLIKGWGVSGALAIEDLLLMGRRFSVWLDVRCPGARLHHEWPVEHQLETGTILRGKVDLLAVTTDKLVVVDHKLVLATESEALDGICWMYGQVKAYADALMAASIGTSVETWVHLPLTGIMARLTRLRDFDNSTRQET